MKNLELLAHACRNEQQIKAVLAGKSQGVCLFDFVHRKQFMNLRGLFEANIELHQADHDSVLYNLSTVVVTSIFST